MRKFIKFTIVISLFLFSAGFAFASDAEVRVSIDGVPVVFTEASGSPFIDENNRTQTPFRQTLEAFGAVVSWEEETRTAIAVKGDITVRVPIGTNYVYKNELRIVNDTTSIIVDDRTFLPIRIVLEAFGADVFWEFRGSHVHITRNGEMISLAILAARVEAAMAGLQSFDAQRVVSTELRLGNETQNIQETITANFFRNPARLRMTSRHAHDDEGITAVMYAFAERSETVLLLQGERDSIARMRIPSDGNILLQAGINPFVAFVIPNLAVSEVTTENRASVVKLEGVISGEMLFRVTTGGEIVPSMMAREIETSDVIVPMSMWINMDTNVIMRYEIGQMEWHPPLPPTVIDGNEWARYSEIMEVTITNINNATRFVIPQH